MYTLVPNIHSRSHRPSPSLPLPLVPQHLGRISPYVFHTHAPRVFSEISAALKRAQEASAEVLAQLNASEKAQVTGSGD